MASIVPFGIELLGSRRSPDMLTPAVNPVTAGKKMPNRTPNEGLPSYADRCTTLVDDSPRNTTRSEPATRTRITYCDLIASEVLMNVITVIATSVTEPQIRIA